MRIRRSDVKPTRLYGQLWTYHAWAQWMKGLDWDALKASTTPGDVL